MTEVKPKEEAGRFPGFAVEGSGTADNVSTPENINPFPVQKTRFGYDVHCPDIVSASLSFYPSSGGHACLVVRTANDERYLISLRPDGSDVTRVEG